MSTAPSRGILSAISLHSASPRTTMARAWIGSQTLALGL
ncbi:hypothetical protein MUK42_07888 [Musa troglodytarum]|uniref:Uncharacterized protein n=1 Tax=Musa troglodytarum TaxID=320322 RepID=A0A9E7J8M2_9LILI|nr:hypothetical protein MUK42_07888 [Musa troglodytarum]